MDASFRNLWIVVGYIVAVISGAGAGIVSASGEGGVIIVFPLAIVAFAGFVMVLVGTIGAGVRLGMRHARWEEARDQR